MKFVNFAASVALLSATCAFAITVKDVMDIAVKNDNSKKLSLPAGKIDELKISESLKSSLKNITEINEENIKAAIDAEKTKIDEEAFSKALELINNPKTPIEDNLGPTNMTKSQFEKFAALDGKDRTLEKYLEIIKPFSVSAHLANNWFWYIGASGIVIGLAATGMYYMKKGDSEETDL